MNICSVNRLVLLAAPLLLVGVVAACGGDDEGTSPTATSPAETMTSEATATATATSPSNSEATPTTPPTATPPSSEGGGGGGGGNGAAPTPTPDLSPVVACGDVLVPLDKQHRLQEDCVPADLVQLPGEMVSGGGQYMRYAAAEAFKELFAAAQKDGYTLLAASTYRSYQSQIAAYQASVNAGGVAYADRVSAWPGHSEHQLGTTVDVTSASAGYSLEGFVGTPEAQWVWENSWKYGFIVSYPDGKEHITGYAYEPWHLRWLGKDEAAKAHGSGVTLHEYLLR